MSFKIIDFHCHPFLCDDERIGGYVNLVNLSTEEFFNHMSFCGVSICSGSVIGKKTNRFEDLHNFNLHALKLREKYPDRYIPGFHIHPDFVEESIKEVDFAIENGVKLIGELVPYHHGWQDYSSTGFMKILDYINSKKLIVSMHIGEVAEIEQLEKAIALYKDTTFVLAHPGYGERIEKHIEILQKYPNAYLDLSGSGIDLFGTVKKLTESTDYKKILFGSDFPVTTPGAWISAVMGENITDDAKRHILGINAERIFTV